MQSAFINDSSIFTLVNSYTSNLACISVKGFVLNSIDKLFLQIKKVYLTV